MYLLDALGRLLLCVLKALVDFKGEGCKHLLAPCCAKDLPSQTGQIHWAMIWFVTSHSPPYLSHYKKPNT